MRVHGMLTVSMVVSPLLGCQYHVSRCQVPLCSLEQCLAHC